MHIFDFGIWISNCLAYCIAHDRTLRVTEIKYKCLINDCVRSVFVMSTLNKFKWHKPKLVILKKEKWRKKNWVCCMLHIFGWKDEIQFSINVSCLPQGQAFCFCRHSAQCWQTHHNQTERNQYKCPYIKVPLEYNDKQDVNNVFDAGGDCDWPRFGCIGKCFGCLNMTDTIDAHRCKYKISNDSITEDRYLEHILFAARTNHTRDQQQYTAKNWWKVQILFALKFIDKEHCDHTENEATR